MKLKHLLTVAAALLPLAGMPARAQDTAAQGAPANTGALTLLPIAAPDGAQALAELDGREGDVLGALKSFLSGVAGGGHAGGGGNPFLGVVTDEQLTALLKNIHHLHAIVFATTAGGDLLPFYEKPFQGEGGHRVAWANAPGGPRVLLEGFDPAPGFAAVVQMPGELIVVRSDGYPDMQVLGKLVRTFADAQSHPQVSPAVEVSPVPAKRPAAGHHRPRPNG